MDISALTQIAKPGTTPKTGDGMTATSVFAATGGFNFFDLIFARATLGEDGKTDGNILADIKTQMATPQANTMTLPVIVDDASIQTPATITLAPVAQEIIDTIPPETQERIQALLDMLTQGLPKGQKPIIVIAPLQSSGDASDETTITLPAGLEKTEITNETLIATGLTVQDLAEISKLAQQGPEAPTILIGIVKILPDGAKNEAVFIPRPLAGLKSLIDGLQNTLKNSPDPLSDEDPTSGIGEIRQQQDNVIEQAFMTLPVTPAPDDVTADSTSAVPVPTTPRSNLNAYLKMLEQAPAPKAENIKPDGVITTPDTAGQPGQKTAHQTPSPAHSSFKAMLSLGAGDFTLGNIFPESPEWAGQKWDGATNVATTTMTMATNLITHAKQAGQAHPAAQAVIATLTRGAQSGENRSFTLQLDPPELGRLEIQMQFTKDKSVKAHMIFEKPETMLMLQRDSQALERALQEAGLDAGGNELSFELATEDHRFGDDGKGSNKSAGKMDKNTTDDRVIESTMTWYVDTETGLQRYNILA